MTLLIVLAAAVFLAVTLIVYCVCRAAAIADRKTSPPLTEREVASRLRPHTSLVQVSGKRAPWR